MVCILIYSFDVMQYLLNETANHYIVKSWKINNSGPSA